ncbi:LeuD: 3-isopropylmalate dehydratase, small subunit [Desulfosarcina variabilis str. Montpellier]|uniref:LeuD/DmdB family oxidoreductase small subunit n=1 Tax=Desulfosarcina variabilis TaxID=2300 RepID=UPI003AFA69FC
MEKITGKAWKFGDGIDTDVIIPARYLVLPMEEMKAYAMAPIQPRFAAEVMPGDVIVAGKNFGCGSSREQAPAVLKALGIKAIVAAGFARIFFRNAINLGLVVMECHGIGDHIKEKDSVHITPESGSIYLPEKNITFGGTRLPGFLLDIVEAGGLIPLF